MRVKDLRVLITARLQGRVRQLRKCWRTADARVFVSDIFRRERCRCCRMRGLTSGGSGGCLYVRFERTADLIWKCPPLRFFCHFFGPQCLVLAMSVCEPSRTGRLVLTRFARGV